jgi:hypothetical protein
MKWSKLKSLVEARFAPTLAKRIAIHSTRYGNCTCGRAWLTIDGQEIANFCTRAHSNVQMGRFEHQPPPAGYGELSRQDAYQACWAFVHDLSIDQALGDIDPLVQSLAVLDGRVGKRRLQTIDWSSLHPLAQRLFRVRLESEKMDIASLSNSNEVI